MDMLRAPIGLGLQIPNFNFPRVTEEGLFEKLSEIATTAEASGFDTVLVMDHLHQIPGVGPPENWMLEATRSCRRWPHEPSASTSACSSRA
jgi:alkanesulfonate monooxygenase SsuD/methylene tetrahydromethanopterin reductase-like flavin-dependent oxidoreductase (luciferase family)